MASRFVSFTAQPLRSTSSTSSPAQIPPAAIHFPEEFGGGAGVGRLTFRRRNRSCTVVTRAGASASSYLLAFAIPVTLVAVTVFTSIKIADKLDEDFLEEVALNQAIMEAEDGEDGEARISADEVVQEPVLQRTRNRPKREV